MMKQSAFSV